MRKSWPGSSRELRLAWNLVLPKNGFSARLSATRPEEDGSLGWRIAVSGNEIVATAWNGIDISQEGWSVIFLLENQGQACPV